MTTTPIPTPEQIIAEAMVNAGAPLMHSRVEEAVASALRAHGLLAEGAPSGEQIDPILEYLDEMREDDRIDYASYVTLHDYISTLNVAAVQGEAKLLQNAEPSEEQVERAAQAFVISSGDDDWGVLDERERESYRRDVRAALTAAGIAPQVLGEFGESATVAASPKADKGLDPEKVAEVLNRDENYTRDPDSAEWVLDSRSAARALCEAHAEGRLT